jgi:hypothetical protein
VKIDYGRKLMAASKPNEWRLEVDGHAVNNGSHRAWILSWSMILSENRFPLFRIML